MHDAEKKEWQSDDRDAMEQVASRTDRVQCGTTGTCTAAAGHGDASGLTRKEGVGTDSAADRTQAAVDNGLQSMGHRMKEGAQHLSNRVNEKATEAKDHIKEAFTEMSDRVEEKKKEW